MRHGARDRRKTPGRDGRVTIEKAGLLPLVTHYEEGYKAFQVYPLYDYTSDLAARHRNKTRRDMTLSYLRSLAGKAAGALLLDADPFK